jgi:hypothetical protein
MENNKPYWLDIIEENLVEAVVAVMFILAFICTGLIAAYFIDTPLIKELAIYSSLLVGLVSLFYKVKGE